MTILSVGTNSLQYFVLQSHQEHKKAIMAVKRYDQKLRKHEFRTIVLILIGCFKWLNRAGNLTYLFLNDLQEHMYSVMTLAFNRFGDSED